MTNLSVKNSTQSISINGREIEFDVPVIDTIVLEDRVLVLLDSYYYSDNDPDAGRNVFAYDANGEFLWRIQDSGFTSVSNRDHVTEVPQGYTGIALENDGRITVNQPIGCEFDVDPETGEISNMVLGR